jgi:hypothetical protein
LHGYEEYYTVGSEEKEKTLEEYKNPASDFLKSFP